MKFRSGIEIHHTLLVALAKNDTLPLVKVNVGTVQFDKLTYTDARGSQDINDS